MQTIRSIESKQSVLVSGKRQTEREREREERGRRKGREGGRKRGGGRRGGKNRKREQGVVKSRFHSYAKSSIFPNFEVWAWPKKGKGTWATFTMINVAKLPRLDPFYHCTL